LFKKLAVELKENIKSKVDKLDPYNLRIVEHLINSLSDNRLITKRKHTKSKPFYLEVISLMGPPGLSSDDITAGREERI